MKCDLSELFTRLEDLDYHFTYYGDIDRHRWGLTTIEKYNDCGAVTESNYDSITDYLLKKHPDSFEAMQGRFNQWFLLVDTEDEDALESLDKVICAISDYPVWDDIAHSKLELERQEEDYQGNLHSQLERIWEKDADNIKIPDDVVWQKPPNIGDTEVDVLWTNEFGGYFSTEKEARDDYIETLELEVPECPYDYEQGFEAYLKAQQEAQEFWSEDSWPDTDKLYPFWRDILRKKYADNKG